MLEGLKAARVNLVATANRLYPREDGREWTAADTLKTVAVTVLHPEDDDHEGPWREVIAVALPGDRQVDMKRLEAQFAPAELEESTEDDLKAMPPEKRAAVEADIDRRIKERLLAENKSPSEFDVQQMSAAALLAEKIKNARSTNAAGNQSGSGANTGASGTTASPAVSML